MPEKLKLLVCRNYQNEAKAIYQLHNWDDVELHLFPQICHQPHLRQHFLEKVTAEQNDANGNLLMLGGCFPEIEARAIVFPQTCVHCLDKCFYMIAGQTLVDRLIDQGDYVLSPGWLEEWRLHLEQWGLDQATARAFFHECTQKMTLLDTGLNPASPAQLQELGDYLDIPTTLIPVGLDYFDLYLSNVVAGWKLKSAQDQTQAVRAELNRNTADSAMAFDLMTQLNRSMSEDTAIEEIVSLFTMLFSPDLLVYCRMVNGELLADTCCNASDEDYEAFKQWALLQNDNYAWIPSGNGFYLRFVHQGQMVGGLLLGNFKLPQYKQHYLSMGISMLQICSMAIYNARIYQKLKETEKLTLQQKEEMSALLIQVQAYTVELEAALKEQNAFSYSISHDLRAPLRIIGSYSSILQQDYGDILPPDAQKLLDRIHTNTARMNQLINDLLTLSKIGHKPLVKENIEPAEIVASVLTYLQDEINQRKIEVVVYPMPSCQGDSVLIREIYENLISNAIKFTFHREKARIEIGYETQLNFCHPPDNRSSLVALPGVYYIKDNGAGFDMAYANKLFGIFQRLHRQDEYEGTGVGLAIVERIVIRHGGAIWAHGEVDHGAAFYFSLP
jgi:signal transduction histidine kinase